ncbi:MAG: PqqD family protein [Acidimicrobiales bacterium]|nr:PqqD family protein [Acidimicrobiales bacterium]
MAVSSHHTVGRGDVLWRATLDGVLIRVPGADEVVQLGGTGAAVWAELATPRTFGDLCAALAESHDAAAARIALDLQPVIADLVERAVVRVDG